MNDRDDILNNEEKGALSEAKLLAYFEGRLSLEEQREVELLLSDDGLESDAMDGLQELSASEIKVASAELKYKLNKDLKTTSRRRKPYNDPKWTILAIFLILMLCVLGFIVIRAAG